MECNVENLYIHCVRIIPESKTLSYKIKRTQLKDLVDNILKSVSSPGPVT